jgi:D-alanyl-lipoteichoic acid acyltransferase DltB (MBOAT superfamily)
MGPGIGRTVAPRRALHQRFLPAPASTDAPRPRPQPEPRPRRFHALYPGEPETCRRSIRPFLVNLTHLSLLLAVFHAYHIEERAFQGHSFESLVTLALLVMPAHYLAPLRWKKPLFVAASVAGLFLVAGPWASIIVLAVAAAFIGACYLPLPWAARAAACAAMAAALACARPLLTEAGVPDDAWTIAASMLMFRMILFLYELKHARAPESPLDAASYFFLLPNYCFLHFPVVDYRTLQRGYFAADVHATQRRGLAMMFRGTLHLLAYRLIYHQMLIPASSVQGIEDLLGFVVCNYLLYLQVSGQFHMACGMLHLFGYQLPETHHRYLLATSFTDYWRRINIYWKDFMVRLFFNPVVFRLKHRPQPIALAAATAAVFLATWVLHGYQLFWLRGGWGFTVPDALFWGTLGALVAVNVQLDARRHPATRGPSAGGRGGAGSSARDLAVRGLKVAATFGTIALLWSLWSSPTLDAWLDTLGRGIGGSWAFPKLAALPSKMLALIELTLRGPYAL